MLYVAIGSYVCMSVYCLYVYIIRMDTYMYIDQLNTTVQASVKPIPYELVFGQPPRKTVFPSVTTSAFMEEDILDIVEEGIDKIM